MVEELPQIELNAARRYLEHLRNMGDPLLWALMQAPLDDEPVTEGERAAVAEALGDVAAGRVVGDDAVRREFGL
ncbi:MAG: hypothetical protein Q8R28_11955 [Dehalococcoidia bacterium]|nr:hypothetical protein [Dehalococcoidia bacterium]